MDEEKIIDVEEVEEDTPEEVNENEEVPSQKKEPSKGLKIFGITVTILMIIIAGGLLWLMATKAFYIQNNACEICVMEEDAVCYIREQMYYKEDDRLNVRNDIIPYYALQETEEQEQDLITEEELNQIFSGIVK